jgi:hypothetical protein
MIFPLAIIGPELAFAGLAGSRIWVSHASLPVCASSAKTALSILVPGDSPEALARNRRIELKFTER